MHVSAFAPAVHAVLQNGGARSSGLPMVLCPIAELPAKLTVPVVLSVWTESGQDLNPCVYVVARDPDGERRGVVEQLWNWPDEDGQPYKFHVFAVYLEILVLKDGIYQVGLYDDPEGTETDNWFPLPVKLDK